MAAGFSYSGTNEFIKICEVLHQIVSAMDRSEAAIAAGKSGSEDVELDL